MFYKCFLPENNKFDINILGFEFLSTSTRLVITNYCEVHKGEKRWYEQGNQQERVHACINSPVGIP